MNPFRVNSESVRNEPVNGAYIDVSKLCILHKGYTKVTKCRKKMATKSNEEGN